MEKICGPTRKTIQDVADWFEGLEFPPQEDDPHYWQVAEGLGNLLAKGSEAFDKRPEGCTMTKQGEQYICRQCHFHVNL
jgi:hypothetical protein